MPSPCPLRTLWSPPRIFPSPTRWAMNSTLYSNSWKIPLRGIGRRNPKSTSSRAWLQDEITLQTTFPLMVRSIPCMVTVRAVRTILCPSGISCVIPSVRMISKNIIGWKMCSAPQFKSTELPLEANKFLCPVKMADDGAGRKKFRIITFRHEL